jgi:phytoene synthase
MRLARAVLAQHSQSFALAGRLLPADRRDDAAILYAWCRRADDAIDHSAPSSKPLRLAELRRELAAIYHGEPQTEPLLAAFASLVRTREIPREYPDALLDGFETDLEFVRFRALPELMLYAYRVAGVVGLMMCHVLGVSHEGAKRNAAHLGIAMQLTNICRDVAEDWALGRLYLPEDLLVAVGAPALDPASRQGLGPARAELGLVLEKVLALADEYYRSGDRGLFALQTRSAIAVRAARLVYSSIGRELARRNYDVLAGRAVVSRGRKLWLVARAVFEELSQRLIPRIWRQAWRQA